MLILTRHPGQIIAIQPHESLRLATPIGRFFTEGPMEILVTRVSGNKVSLGIKAHEGFLIYRSEVGAGYGNRGGGRDA